ncbi:MAG: hypothetical protein D6690_04370 [Nitrospirae bacterium]|nr:MAG: hypothetical protein D6690_04370 [Nitrospirota bacterium]
MGPCSQTGFPRALVGWVILVGLLSALTVDPPCGWAALFEEWRHQQETLHGIQTLWVKVRMGTVLEGPTRQRLQTDVERALRVLPIQLLPEQEGASYEQPALIIEVMTVKPRLGSAVHFLTARLHQPVLLKRQASQSAYAVTWKGSTVGEGGLERIREKILSLVELFIHDFRQAHATQ